MGGAACGAGQTSQQGPVKEVKPPSRVGTEGNTQAELLATVVPGMVGLVPSLVGPVPSLVGLVPSMVGLVPSMVGVGQLAHPLCLSHQQWA